MLFRSLCGGGGLNAGRSAAHLRWYGLDGSTPERARGGRRGNGNRRRGGDDGLARGGATAVCTGAPGQPRPLCTTSKQISPAGTLGGVALGARSRALEKETSAGRSIEGSRRSARVYSRSDDYGRQLRKLAGGTGGGSEPGRWATGVEQKSARCQNRGGRAVLRGSSSLLLRRGLGSPPAHLGQLQ